MAWVAWVSAPISALESRFCHDDLLVRGREKGRQAELLSRAVDPRLAMRAEGQLKEAAFGLPSDLCSCSGGIDAFGPSFKGCQLNSHDISQGPVSVSLWLLLVAGAQSFAGQGMAGLFAASMALE